ncbi:MAG TPA: diadenylate cyclase CdaA [Thermomicrobiales bacterium]|nr:diadenylate cyclase CdaA [Thermomicrobiales bacterium]
MTNLGWLLERMADPRSIIDILTVTVIFYWLLWVAQGTRALHLIRGILTLLALLLLLGKILDLSTLQWLLRAVSPALIVAVPVIFQPELRRAFEQLGHTSSWLRNPFQQQDEPVVDRAIDEIVRAAAQLSRLRYGALMVIERETGLQDYVSKGVMLNADISRQLLINIFFPNSPLHDAAVIIQGDRILAASVVLPLTDNISASSQLGTRHRAAIGVTEESDALAVVVSEETGQMSVAHSGRLIRNLDQDRLRRVLRTLMKIDSHIDTTKQTPTKQTPTKRFPFADFFRPDGAASRTSSNGLKVRERDSAQTRP